MKALQYIYTSWKNGSSSEKGYMIYSCSEGITEKECNAIKDAMRYLAPKEMNLTPTAQEIADEFPYSFSYFVLPTGRGCIAQSTYLGKDYSGRYGNYIIYAMIFELEDMDFQPSEFFGEPFIKTYMTQEELDAPSPVPPLPPIAIENFGNFINDEALADFLCDKEEEFSQLISLVLFARDNHIPFYLNDTRENLVFWSAGLQRILPKKIYKKFTFNTYVCDHEFLNSNRVKEEGIDFHLIGVRPDANFFNYAMESKGNRCVVIDFLGGSMTEGVLPTLYSNAMASSITIDCSEIDEFSSFIDGTSIKEINGELVDAYAYFCLLTNHEYEYTPSSFHTIIRFGETYCNQEQNSEVGAKLLELIQQNSITIEMGHLREFWRFINKYVDYMIFTLYDIITDTIYQLAGDSDKPLNDLRTLLREIRSDMPDAYRGYLEYFSSNQTIEQLLLYLEGHDNLFTNDFYSNWLLENYAINDLDNRRPVSKLLRVLLNNITNIPNSEKLMLRIMFSIVRNKPLFINIAGIFVPSFQTKESIEKFCDIFSKYAESRPKEAQQIEKFLPEVPNTGALVFELTKDRIINSNKPDEEFWNFFNTYKAVASDSVMSAIVLAYLSYLEQNVNERAIFEILTRLDTNILKFDKVRRILLNIVEEMDVSSLEKQGDYLFKKILEICEENVSLCPKCYAVWTGRNLERQCTQSAPSMPLSSYFESNPIVSLKTFSRAEYTSYLKTYLRVYFPLMKSSADVETLMNVFYHSSCFSLFIDEYIVLIKKVEKKGKKWATDLIAWTCINILSSRKGHDAIYSPWVRYLKTMEESDFQKVRQISIQEISVAEFDLLAEDVHKKESLQDKIGGLFRRK